MFMASALPGKAFTKISTATPLNYIMKRACTIAGLRPIWTSHASRCGWATEAWMRGVPFTTLRELGRWKSHSSLRIYLDSVGAMAIMKAPEALRAQQWTAAMDGHDFERFWAG